MGIEALGWLIPWLVEGEDSLFAPDQFRSPEYDQDCNKDKHRRVDDERRRDTPETHFIACEEGPERQGADRKSAGAGHPAPHLLG